ncbi:hypothetical protein DTO195F2_356 [Paecilomyces variotii]|nr:hypothetical protein DTO195F2_356 [Paecilomyces variotii]KAJ9373445.1 hypothetical protein DTO282E5_1896 [Paecilomyces variotii]
MVQDDNQPSSGGDYDLSRPLEAPSGLRQGLTSYGDAHFSLFLRKVFIKALGYSDDALSRPIIGIINTYSGFNPCHANVPQLIEAAKRGVQLHGGLAVDFPTISVHESFAHPTSMFLRNLMSMDTEEMIKAQPLDACIMIGGCDKTVPAQLMGGISANKPILPLITGPMMPGSHRGQRLGACTDCRNNWAAFRANEIDIEEISAINEELAPTIGTCGVMGTASTMACITAGLGMMPLRPLLHLSAMTISGQTLGEVLDASSFRSFPYSQQLIRPLSDPLYPSSSLVVLYGNIAPNGAVMKASASKDLALLSHSGPAVVFKNSADLAARIDDPDLPVTKDSVLVLQGIGPIGNPGMPEAGLIPIPRKLGASGVKDMLRLSDGRMSGTAGGTIVLHISPESALPDSPFGVVQTGDIITCNVEKRVLHLDISDDELEARIEERKRSISSSGVLSERSRKRGYRGLYERSVNQAEEGVDFDFLTAAGPGGQ